MSEELEFEDRMSDSDALMWQIEKDPVLRSTITAVAVLDRQPDREHLLSKIDRGSRLVPRMRQRVVGNMLSLAPPRWEYDPHFDLRYHVRFVSAGGHGTMRDVLDLAEPIAMHGFDRSRPLWEFVVVEDLADGNAAVIQKLHHAITDGIGGVKIAMVMLDMEREAEEEGPLPPEPAVHVMSPAERLVDGLGHVARRQAGIARRSLSTLARGATGALSDPAGTASRTAFTLGSVQRLLAPETTPLSPIMTERSLSFRFDTLTLPLDDLKAASKGADGKLNDAFLAGVVGGLARYHDDHAAPVEALRVNMPINVRDGASESVAGNRFVPARFTLPCTHEDPVERMRAIHDIVLAQREEPANALTEQLALVLNRLPTTVTTAVFGSMLRGVDFTASNVPGIPFPVYMGGAQVLAMYPFGPLAGGAVNVTLLSNLDEVDLGINIDPVAVPDPEVLVAHLRESFDEVLKVSA